MAGQPQGQTDPSNDQNLDQNSDQTLDTQDPEATSPADESGHEDVQANSSSTAPQKSGQPDEEIARREAGKLRQVQEEYKKAQQELARLKTIEEKLMETPERFEKALVEINGVDPTQARAYVEDLKRQGRWQQQNPYQQQIPQQMPPMVDPYKAAEETFQKLERARNLQSEFFNRVPELDPKNVPAERHPTMSVLVSAVEYEAQRRLVENPSLNLVDTLVNVYKEITGKTDEQLAQVKQEAKMEGYLEANAGKVSSNKSPKGYSPKENSFGLSPEEIQEAQSEGLTLEEFAKLKDPVSRVA